MKINKPDIIKKVASKLETSQTKVEPVLDAVIETIIETVSSGEDVKIHGFGKFECKIRASKIGRNPKTGEEVAIPEKRAVKFSAGTEFREAMEE